MDARVMLLLIMPTLAENTPPLGLDFWITSAGENLITDGGDDLVFNPG